MVDDTKQVEELGLIAGRGVYPHELVTAARDAGVKRISAIAFKGETSRNLVQLVDEIVWINVGQFERFLGLIEQSEIKNYVMVGQIAPRNLFRTRPDKKMFALLKDLPHLNAHSIFGAICREIEALGVELLPAHQFMQSAMPGEGVLTSRSASEEQMRDVDVGLMTARAVSALDIGQTVVVKGGMIMAVEAFEGTDKTIRRAGKLGAGRGGVVVKVAKDEHDMRFDIPVIGMRTMRSLKKAGIEVLVVEAGRTILLEKAKVIQAAEKFGMVIMAVGTQDKSGE